MSKNTAAWITKAKGTPLEIKEAPYTSPGKNEILIRNAAIAINPLDWMVQVQGTSLMYPWLKYPFILGIDVAGEVVEVGPGVTRFMVGDRVCGVACGSDKDRNNPAMGGFQSYTVLLSSMASPIPQSMSYETASVIPLGATTAAAGLFQDDQLALELPSLTPSPKNKTVLIWGGSTSVGCNAIQLAVAAGYEVFTTSSPKNFDLTTRLGATKVFDYNSPTVISDIVEDFKGKKTAGAFSVGAGGAEACLDILQKCKGRKFVAMATYPQLPSQPESFVIARTAFNFVTWSISTTIKSKLRGIGWKFIFATTIVDNRISKALFEDYLPEALAQGTFIAAPDPMVVGHGLDRLQEAMDIHRKGVSAKKVVVTL